MSSAAFPLYFLRRITEVRHVERYAAHLRGASLCAANANRCASRTCRSLAVVSTTKQHPFWGARMFAFGEDALACRRPSARSVALCGECEPVRFAHLPLLGDSSNNKTAPLLGCCFVVGAATRIRTGDLMLTKHVLYQLSHSSVTSTAIL